MNSNKVKLLSAVVAAAALMASPALAASKTHKAKYSNAHASQPQQAHELYGWEGQPLGTDPDPNIRFQLQRDQNLGGN
jgi:heat shock protein HslJ